MVYISGRPNCHDDLPLYRSRRLLPEGHHMKYDWRSIVVKVRSYMDNSSIHGLKYITQSDRHWTERLFWVLTCASAVWCSASLASLTHANFLNKPVSFLVNRDNLHWNTSFPAVSVCEADADLGAIALSANRLFGDPHDLDLETFLRDIVFFEGKCYSCEELCGKNINCIEDLSSLIKKVRQPCTSLLLNCSWMGKPMECCEFFKPVVTETGLCYSTNSIQSSGSFDKLKYQLNRQTGPGRLEFVVSKDVNVYMHTTEDVPYINNPQETKNMVIMGSNFKMGFTVTEIENDGMLGRLPVEQRKCRFPSENNLRVYNYYSYSACVVDCRIEAQIRFCNCTHHFMPKIIGIKTCTIEGLACLSKNSKMIGSLKSMGGNKPGLVCPCFCSCTEHDHRVVETILTPYEDNKLSLIRIQMASLPTTRFQRYIVRTKLDLVVSLGGTAGLFLGVSLLSLAEAFYFIVLRKGTKRPTVSKRADNNIRNKMYMKKIHLKVQPLFIPYLP